MSPFEREREKARFILAAAKEAGIHVVGTDGYWLDVIYPRGLPKDVHSNFSLAFSAHHDAIVAFIQAENRR
jgi:hypothetical protein